MMNLWSSILIVDDEKNTRQGLQQFLGGLDYDVSTAANGQEALESIKREKPEIVLADLKMPDMDGLELLHEIRRQWPDILVIILTAYGTVENAVHAMKAGAYYYLTKPVNLEELELILKKALTQKNLEQENIDLRAELIRERHESSEIIGQSREIKKLISLAKQVARARSTILIQGESGTGKELFAHLIHTESERRNRPFITVHMAALAETLLASELFGHERGAFTGATERKLGRFERADGGTLFLDEISEIPEHMQTKLLRVLQVGEFERVGGTKTIRSDVRLICATNKNLQEEVRAGRFREDLYYRINVILFQIPPLRDRKSDIPLLVDHFVRFFSKINRKAVVSVSPEAMNLLSQYRWPGNIRELKNVIERMVVLSSSKVIDVSQVPEDLKRENSTSLLPQKLIFGAESANNLEDMEKKMIREALRTSSGNKSLAAKKLGIARRTLYRKMEEYQISGINDSF